VKTRRPDPAGPEAALLAAGATVTRVRGPAAAPRRHKYGARRTVVDGVTFPSRREARRYGELKVLERAGRITGLELQPRFRLVVNGRHVGDYLADFRYVEGGRSVVEDAKGVRTPVYRLKKKLVLALYGIQIREV
jgi:hypothetical protein